MNLRRGDIAEGACSKEGRGLIENPYISTVGRSRTGMEKKLSLEKSSSRGGGQKSPRLSQIAIP